MKRLTPPPASRSLTVRFFPGWYDIASGAIGKPYVAGACGPDEFYCAGLIAWWFRAFGYCVPDPQGMTAEELNAGGFCDFFTAVEFPEFGDVAKIICPGEAPHLGICTFNGILQATRHGVTLADYGTQVVPAHFRLKAIAAEVGA